MATPTRGTLADFVQAGPVRALAFGFRTGARSILASGGDDGTILLWDPETGLPIGRPLIAHVGAVRGLAFTHTDLDPAPGESLLLASAGQDGTVQVWDPEVQAVIRTISVPQGGPQFAIAATYAGGHAIVAAGGADGLLRIWDADSGELMVSPITDGGGAVTALTVSDQSDPSALLLSGHSDGTFQVRVLRALEAEPLRMRQGSGAPIVAVACGPPSDDGPTLIEAASASGTVGIWDLSSATRTGNLYESDQPVVSAGFSVSGNSRPIVAVGRATDLALVSDPASEPRLDLRFDSTSGPVLTVAVTTDPSGRTTAAGGTADGVIHLWDATSRDLTTELAGHRGAVWDVALADRPNGTLMLATAGQDVRLWSLDTGELIFPPLSEPTLDVKSVAFGTTPDGPPLLAAAGFSGSISVWDTGTGRRVGSPIDVPSLWPGSLTFGEDQRGSPLLAAGSLDGLVRLWSPTSGDQIGSSIPTGQGGVYSLLFVSVDGVRVLAAGTADGSLILWALENGGVLAVTDAAHQGPVRALAVIPDRNQLVSGGDDGVVRLWRIPSLELVQSWSVGNRIADLSTAAQGTNHIVATAASSGEVGVWNADTGALGANPTGGHQGFAYSVAFSPPGADPPLLASAGGDGTVRVWDPVSGRDVTPRRDETQDDPAFPRPASAVLAVAGAAAGAATAAAAGTVGATALQRRAARRSSADPDDGPGDGPVPSESATAADDLAAGDTYPSDDLSSGDDLFPSDGPAPPTSATADAATETADGPTEPAEEPGSSVVDDDRTDQAGAEAEDSPTGDDVDTSAPAVRDDTSAESDDLGRAILARHLGGLLDQLTNRSASHDDKACSAVVHVDGRWGSGKTTLVRLLRAQLADPPLEGATSTRLVDPIFIEYDAWRESAVAPEWWSLATTINRGIRGERAGATRLLMSVVGVVRRLWRSTAARIAIGALAIVVVTRALGFWSDLETASKGLTLLTAVVAVGLSLGRVLFWTAPAFGKLATNQDDNPLQEIAEIVTRLRRWSPRPATAHRLADSLLCWWLLLVVALVVRVLLDSDEAVDDTTSMIDATWTQAWPTILFVVVLMLSYSTWPPRSAAVPAEPPAAVTTEAADRESGGHDTRPSWFWLVVGAIAGLVTYAAADLSLPDRAQAALETHPELWGTGLAVLGIATYTWWLRSTRHKQRRTVVVVVDDLDRCAADRVVRLLETVHTLLRQHDEVQVLGSWREPAPLVFLVLSDGRWVRTAFEHVYSDFNALGSAVYGLGADFLEKLFDHTVLVPALSADQVDDITRIITGGAAAADGAAEPTGGASAAGTGGATIAEAVPTRPAATPPSADDVTRSAEIRHDAATKIAQAAPGDLRSSGIEELLGNADLTGADRQQLLGIRVEFEATGEATAATSSHLLTRYPALMPANPRLIKRVANAYGMLQAIKDHLGHDESLDTIARAAIFLVRFPNLVDDLLTDPTAPDPTEPPSQPGPTSNREPQPLTWTRADVHEVLRLDDNRLLDVARLAICYGRRYPPPAQLASPPGSGPAASPATSGAEPSDGSTA